MTDTTKSRAELESAIGRKLPPRITSTAWTMQPRTGDYTIYHGNIQGESVWDGAVQGRVLIYGPRIHG